MAVYSGLFLLYCALNYKSIKAMFNRVFKRKQINVTEQPLTEVKQSADDKENLKAESDGGDVEGI